MIAALSVRVCRRLCPPVTATIAPAALPITSRCRGPLSLIASANVRRSDEPRDQAPYCDTRHFLRIVSDGLQRSRSSSRRALPTAGSASHGDRTADLENNAFEHDSRRKDDETRRDHCQNDLGVTVGHIDAPNRTQARELEHLIEDRHILRSSEHISASGMRDPDGSDPRRLAFQRHRHPCGGARRTRTAPMGPSRCRHSSNCESGEERNPCRPAALSRKAEGFFHRMADRKRCRSQGADARSGVKGAGMAVASSCFHRARECSSCWRSGSRIV